MDSARMQPGARTRLIRSPVSTVPLRARAQAVQRRHQPVRPASITRPDDAVIALPVADDSLLARRLRAAQPTRDPAAARVGAVRSRAPLAVRRAALPGEAHLR